MDEHMTDRARKVLIFLFVTGVHVVAIIWISWLPHPPINSSEGFYSTYIVIEPPSSAKTQLRTQRKGSVPEGAESPEHIESHSSVSDPALIAPSIDWQEQGSLTADDVVARRAQEEGRRSLANPKTNGSSSAPKESVNLFPQPLHKNGDSQRLGNGELITWISNACYATNQPFAAPQLDENSLHIVCKDPFKDRTDLFDHLKPKHLQAAPNSDVEVAAPTCSYSSTRCK
jgi:hypothetical protein